MDSFSEILVASSDPEMRRSIVAILRRLGVDPVCASTVRQCGEVLARQHIGLVFCDRQFTDGSYRDLVVYAGSGLGGGGTRIVLTTNFIGPGEYHEAKGFGVFDVIASPSHSLAVEWMVLLAARDDLERRDHELTTRGGLPGFPRSTAA